MAVVPLFGGGLPPGWPLPLVGPQVAARATWGLACNMAVGVGDPESRCGEAPLEMAAGAPLSFSPPGVRSPPLTRGMASPRRFGETTTPAPSFRWRGRISAPKRPRANGGSRSCPRGQISPRERSLVVFPAGEVDFCPKGARPPLRRPGEPTPGGGWGTSAPRGFLSRPAPPALSLPRSGRESPGEVGCPLPPGGTGRPRCPHQRGGRSRKISRT